MGGSRRTLVVLVLVDENNTGEKTLQCSAWCVNACMCVGLCPCMCRLVCVYLAEGEQSSSSSLAFRAKTRVLKVCGGHPPRHPPRDTQVCHNHSASTRPILPQAEWTSVS